MFNQKQNDGAWYGIFAVIFLLAIGLVGFTVGGTGTTEPEGVADTQTEASEEWEDGGEETDADSAASEEWEEEADSDTAATEEEGAATEEETDADSAASEEWE